MDRKIILSADATCDLDEELKKRYEVYYSPYHIILDGQDYIDNVDITATELYQAYWGEKAASKTAAINVAEYTERFRPWVDAGFDVIHINLSSAISASHQNCLTAEALGHVYPVDSLNLSTGSGLLVIEAADMIRARASSAGNSDAPSRHDGKGPRQLYSGHLGIYACRRPVLGGCSARREPLSP